jgi:predicted amidohydrolase YtcJ
MTLIYREAYFCLLVILIAFAGCQSQQEADLLITGGTIYTMDPQNPVIEAVAVKDGIIVFAGNTAEANSFKGKKTEVLDLEGQTMTPGLIESHAHFLGIGYNKMNLDLMYTKSYQELVDEVASAVAKAKPGEWILGRGWHQSKWDSLPDRMVKGFQTHELLSAVSPDNPVWLKHASGHAAFANAKAMELAGITGIKLEGIPDDPEGGEVIRDDKGNPTGIFNETAMSLINKIVPKEDLNSHLKAMEYAYDECLRHGITSFHDAGSDSLAIAAFLKAAEERSMRVRLYVMLSSRDSALLQHWYQKGPMVGASDHFLTIRSIKLFVDGALGSRGAWLLEPYEDRPGHYGHETMPVPYVLKVAREGLEHGFQVCAHAIGDRANREVLNQYEQAFQESPEKAKDHRFRIEHAQHISGQDIPRFAQLGVIPSMQAIHMSSDRPWAIYRLGLARIQEGAYVWKKLLETGAVVLNGTDAPVEPVNALASFYASVTRKTLQGEPKEGFEPEQKMTRQEALYSYTKAGAYGAFEEKLKGSIAVGKLADFTVFSKDIMTVPEAEILQTDVAYTIVHGKILFRRE